MTDHTFVVSFEYGYEGSSVKGVYLTFDAAAAAGADLVREYGNTSYLEINEWSGAKCVKSWRCDESDGPSWKEQTVWMV